ncbi:hypothetical protein CO174_00785 [Candidatus Uhrbacteria bacterium CG_4_9_14_3_um_filter_50_9]|uniref:Recombinase domain-containing protein n=1 Tax=Candidatus Uhrbacteria bacterium CG_4_9_14_3_um_filter_50_9 TaxID=1975035 RepID=A0A2M7XE95_9BACT|nr:MAG: hypothetical protein CO174_00785 [Candidatus Uhrbacteria bacterium CG_4_9_14_3_um_filter_50_9]
MKNNQDINYFMYCRKSSEDSARQVQSIENQKEIMSKLAHDMGLNVVDIFTESRSAKEPGNRPRFEKMLERIRDGDANGILCWKIDRLSRNPVDSGTLQWMLQKQIIKSIQTIDREYQPEDNALILAVESGVANQYILDLRKSSMRGTQRKLQQGWRPGVAPLGYLNEKDDQGLGIVVPDPERYDLVRRLWDFMLTGSYTIPQLFYISSDEWGLRTRKMRRQGGKAVSLSGLHRIFTNDFYTGSFTYSGELYEGKHKPMISLNEFDRVQQILGRKGKPRAQSHNFAFTGFIRCGECGCSITAEKKTKYIKSTGKTKSYVYYRCTKKRRELHCSQSTCVREEELETQMSTELKKITILPEFRDWALEVLGTEHKKEVETRSKLYESQQKALRDAQGHLDSLTDMRIKKLLTDDEYLLKRDQIKDEIKRLKHEVVDTESRAEHWLELTEQTFNFATYARVHFNETEDLQLKKQIMMALGSNPTIQDGKLSIELSEWLVPIAEGYPALEMQFRTLEPTKNGQDKRKMNAIASVHSSWLGGRDSNPRPIGYT